MKQVKLRIPQMQAFDPVRDLDGRTHEIDDDVDSFNMRWNGRSLRFDKGHDVDQGVEVYRAGSIGI